MSQERESEEKRNERGESHGKLSEEERVRVSMVLEQFDANKDGEISSSELQEIARVYQQKGKSRSSPEILQYLEYYDANKGSLSFSLSLSPLFTSL
jgi:Ca2+-binding EF-hand superfamily protein